MATLGASSAATSTLGARHTVFDPSLGYRIEFKHGAVKCEYYRTVTRRRRKWLEEHKDWWRPFDGVAVLRPRNEGGDIETPPLPPSAESNSNVEPIPAGPSSPTLPSDVRSNSDDRDAAPAKLGSPVQIGEIAAQRKSAEREPVTPTSHLRVALLPKRVGDGTAPVMVQRNYNQLGK